MPNYTRGKKRETLVFVLINDFMYFGFKPKNLSSLTGVSTTDIAALGHVAASATIAGKIKVIGAQAPKPPIVRKKLSGASIVQQQSVSTFCGYSNLGAAQLVGWNLTKSRHSVSLRASSASRASLTAIAKLSDGSRYCFSMNKADFEDYGAELGLESSATITSSDEQKTLVFGSSIPYPGRASKSVVNGSSFSSFFSTAKQGDLPAAEYDILSEEKVINTGTVPFFR